MLVNNTVYYYNVNMQVLLQVNFSSGEQMKWETGQFSVSDYINFAGKGGISDILKMKFRKVHKSNRK